MGLLKYKLVLKKKLKDVFRIHFLTNFGLGTISSYQLKLTTDLDTNTAFLKFILAIITR